MTFFFYKSKEAWTLSFFLLVIFACGIFAALPTSSDPSVLSRQNPTSSPDEILSNLLEKVRKSPESICSLAKLRSRRSSMPGSTRAGTLPNPFITRTPWGWTELMEDAHEDKCALYLHFDQKSCSTPISYRWPSARVQRDNSLRSSYRITSAWSGQDLANGFAFFSDSQAWVTLGWVLADERSCEGQVELAIRF